MSEETTVDALRIQLAFLAPALADFALSGLQIYELMLNGEAVLVPRSLVCVIALSWGVLLLVAFRRPKERSWVLGPTILVVTLIGVANLVAFMRDAITLTDLSIALFVCSIMVGLSWSGWLKLREAQPQ